MTVRTVIQAVFGPVVTGEGVGGGGIGCHSLLIKNLHQYLKKKERENLPGAQDASQAPEWL